MKPERTQADRVMGGCTCRSLRPIRLLCFVALALMSGLPATHAAQASEFRFVVKDLPDSTAAWLPNEVLIHRETDVEGGLVFLLVNPTARTHVFLVEGLEERSVDENGELKKRPLSVTVGPEETVRTVIDAESFTRGSGKGAADEFRFYCPLHRADDDPGGTIRLIHFGGTIRIVQ